MPQHVPLIPINLDPATWPDLIRNHFKLRIKERGFKMEDLQQIGRWGLTHPHAKPDEDWYRQFPTFILVGHGPYPKSILEINKRPWGRRLARFQSKLLQPVNTSLIAR